MAGFRSPALSLAPMPRKEPLRTSYGNKSGAGGTDTNQQLPWIGYRCDGERRRAPAAEKEGRRWQGRHSGEGGRDGRRGGGGGVTERAKGREEGRGRENWEGGRKEGAGRKCGRHSARERRAGMATKEGRCGCVCGKMSQKSVFWLETRAPVLASVRNFFADSLWSRVDHTDSCLQSLTGHPTSAARQPRGVSPRRCPSRRQAGFHAARRNQQGTGWE